jgi:hypothetical protein
MDRGQRRTGRVAMGIAAAVLLLLPPCASAALINLQAYVLQSLVEEDGTTPLADGSIVQIIGSSNAVIDAMDTYGGTTNIIALPTGDDILLGTVRIDSTDLGSNGTFFAGNFFYQSMDVNYMYLRFFNTTGALTGLIYWGETIITGAMHDQNNVIDMNFVGGFAATNQDNFVVIPEPDVTRFLLLGVMLVGGLRWQLRPRGRPKSPSTARRSAPGQ